MGYGHVTNEPSLSGLCKWGSHKNLVMLIDEKSNKAAIITINELDGQWLPANVATKYSIQP